MNEAATLPSTQPVARADWQSARLTVRKPALPSVGPQLLRRPRLGFLGLGWIGRNRLQAVARRQLAQIVALADASPVATEAAADLARRAIVAQDLEELLAVELDGIVIATPSALHAEQTIAALQAGCAVFCQKPLARSVTETNHVLDAARGANRLLGIDLSYRHTAGMQAIRRLIREGELGDVFAIEMAFHNAYGPDKAWFYDAKLSGGGCLMDLGTHLVDLALWCLDFPEVERVSSQLLFRGMPLKRFTRNEQVEDYAAAQIHLKTGAVIQLSCSWKAPAGCDAHISATFFGTQGGAGFRNVGGSFYDFVAEQFLPDRSRRVLAAPPEDWGGRAIVDWTRRLARSREFDPEIERTQQVAAVLDALYHSCA